MPIQITSDNVQITPSMQNLAQQKLERLLSRLQNYPEDMQDIRIVLNTAPLEKFETKIELNLGSQKYFAQKLDFKLETSIIEAVEDIDRQLEKDKDRSQDWENARETKRYNPESGL